MSTTPELRGISQKIHERDQEKLPARPLAGRGSQSFPVKLFEVADRERVSYSLPIDDPSRPEIMAINMATLQRVRLHALRYKIAEEVETYYRNKIVFVPGHYQADSVRSIDTHLHAYCNAIRDLDYMRVRGGPDKTKDPFIITSSHELDRTLLYEVGLIPTRQKIDLGQDYEEPLLTQRSRTETTNEEKLKAFGERIQGAVLGIVALFGPVLIMIFVPSLAATLATTFAAVVLVTIGLAAMPDFSPKDVMGLSFAYAAVLVVFIGTGLAPVA